MAGIVKRCVVCVGAELDGRHASYSAEFLCNAV